MSTRQELENHYKTLYKEKSFPRFLDEIKYLIYQDVGIPSSLESVKNFPFLELTSVLSNVDLSNLSIKLFNCDKALRNIGMLPLYVEAEDSIELEELLLEDLSCVVADYVKCNEEQISADNQVYSKRITNLTVTWLKDSDGILYPSIELFWDFERILNY